MSEETGQPLSPAEVKKIDAAFAKLADADYYELLGVERDASGSDVKKAYYRVSKSFHPDRYFRRPLGNYKEKLEALFDVLTKAYNTLSDPRERAGYDRKHPPKKKVVVPSRASRAQEKATGSAKSRRPSRGAPGTRPAGSRAPRIPRPQRMPPPKPIFQSALVRQLMERRRKAHMYFKQGKKDYDNENYEGALGNLQLATSFDPRNATAKTLMESCRAQVADTRAEVHYQKGMHAEMLGSTDSAKKLFQMAVDCRPKKAYYYSKLASRLTGSDELRGRLEALKLAHKYEPSNKDVLLKLGASYETANMPRNALREYEKVLELQKGHDEAETALRRLKSVI